MLVSFSIRNFRAFRERAEWSLIASPDKTREEDNVVKVPDFGLRLLKSAVVYGANASGKSKLLEALVYMRDFVKDSSRSGQVGQPTGVEPFRLNPAAAQAPSEFEIQFVLENELYRYGFEVSAARVEAEWLFVRGPKGVRAKPETELFYRNGQVIKHHARQFGGIVGELVKNAAVRENALLLSVSAQFNQPRATSIVNWFKKLGFLSGFSDTSESTATFLALHTHYSKARILSFLADADLSIEDVVMSEQADLTVKPDEERAKAVERFKNWSNKEYAETKTQHRAYTDAREVAEPVNFSLQNDESVGTQRILVLAGWVLAALELGYMLVVDELDARLHPNLVCKIVHLFNSKETNLKGAQLLFNTHDTNLLASGNFRRDQIWFTEKNRYGEATLYSLADFKPRRDENFEANYVRGKYGAVPFLGDFGALPKGDAVTTENETADEQQG